MNGAVRLILLALTFCAIAVAMGLGAIGLPVPAAVTVALLIVGVATIAVERRMGRPLPGIGPFFVILAGLTGIAAMVQALPQVNGWVVGLTMLALEIAALIGAIKLYQRLAGEASVQLRRRLAKRRGWEYLPEATVPVPGPHTAPRWKGVPNDASSTIGRHVVYANVNGLAVTVFDRMRPNERNAGVQTVWLVHLPMALPFVLSSFVRYLESEEQEAGAARGQTAPARSMASHLLDPMGTSATGLGSEIDKALGLPPIRLGQPGDHTDHPDFARTLLTRDVRLAAAQSGFPMRWWIENSYLCVVSGDEERTGAKPAEIEEWVLLLTAFAARFPWPALGPYAAAPAPTM